MEKTIMMTTSNRFDGYRIEEYLGVIQGEMVVPNGILGAITNRTFFTIEALSDARVKAFDEILKKAQSLHANAIVSVDVDINSISTIGVMVSVNGTAVRIKKINDVISEQTIELYSTNQIEEFICPSISLNTEGDNQRNVSLDLRVKEQLNIEGILADIVICSIFNEEYIVENLPFLDFEKTSVFRMKSGYSKCLIPEQVLKTMKNISVRVKKYAIDEHVVTVENDGLIPLDEQRSIKAEADTESGLFADEVFKLDDHYLALSELKNSKEIMEYLQALPCKDEFYMEKLIPFVEKRIYTERMYGITRMDVTLGQIKRIYDEYYK